MEDRIRLRLIVGKSARDFANQHPSEVEGHAATATELGKTVDRMEELVASIERGHRDATGATQEKQRLLGVVHREFLKPMAAIARGNGTLDPQVGLLFRTPDRGADSSAYLGAARTMARQAEGHKPLFVRDGMPETFVQDLDKVLDDVDAAVTAFNNARSVHVGSRAELASLAKEVMVLIKRLDGINRYRYRKDPQGFAAWQTARNVAWPISVPVKQAPVEEAPQKQQPAA